MSTITVPRKIGIASAPPLRYWMIAGAVIGIIIAILFRQSFSAPFVLFSSDGPLAIIMARSATAIKYFFGCWTDLNWVGSAQPSATPNITMAIYLLLKPIGFAKFYVPITLVILGISAWLLFRQLRFRASVCFIGAIAAALNSEFFSLGCWGLGGVVLSVACSFLALAALCAGKRYPFWLRGSLAGLALGMGVAEGYDVGAIFSLYIAAAVVYGCFLGSKQSVTAILSRGFAGVALVALLAGLIAAQTLSTLVSTQVAGVVNMQQDSESKARRWTEATTWSLPKTEALRVMISGLFGYRMDTADGGNYWGSVGEQGNSPRSSGSGTYAGVLVVLLAGWSLVRSFFRSNSPFSDSERKWIWFCGGAALVSLLLSFGRHAPFYRFVYALPYFSTIRNPIKFLHPLSLALVVLFGFGLEGLFRFYIDPIRKSGSGVVSQFKIWWKSASKAERNWTFVLVAIVGLSLLGWLIYNSSRTEMLSYLKQGGFPEPYNEMVFRFSQHELGIYILFLLISASLIALIMIGKLAGSPKLAACLIGAILICDLARANLPWIVYYDYIARFAGNPIIAFLKQDTKFNRVAGRVSPMTNGFFAQGNDFPELYNEFLQNQFQYYRIPSIDIIQMPRPPELDANYLAAFAPKPNNLFSIGRLWELTSTRYLLGMAGFLDALNQQVQPAFQIATNFGKGSQGVAVFELTNALPRAALYSSWTVNTNDVAVLQMLANPSFKPSTGIVISDVDAPRSTAVTNAPNGMIPATITHYEPKVIRISANASRPSILMLNDRFHPDWKVSVDGKSAKLLRCNYIMRGVYLLAGEHSVEFRYEPNVATFYVSLGGIGLAICLCGILGIWSRRPETIGVGASASLSAGS